MQPCSRHCQDEDDTDFIKSDMDAEKMANFGNGLLHRMPMDCLRLCDAYPSHDGERHLQLGSHSGRTDANRA